MKDSPELLELLSDFKDMMKQLRTELHPIQTSDAAQGRATRKTHADYVDVKYHLLLSYCSNISYYMMLKARGRVVKVCYDVISLGIICCSAAYAEVCMVESFMIVGFSVCGYRS